MRALTFAFALALLGAGPAAAAPDVTSPGPLGLSPPDGWEPPTPPENPPVGPTVWEKIELPDTYCGNGSQYKFFVSRAPVSRNLLIVLEPGGACWDYPSCTGQAGVMGAANPNGIPDDHMTIWGVHTPLMWRWTPNNPFREWNIIFIPYCTGDIHSGNSITTYSDPTGQNPDIEYRHVGHNNMMKVIDWIGDEFEVIPKMFVTGCSAGGTGSQVNYYYLRSGLPQVREGYLLNDSGPIFPDSTWSAPLHETIRESWNLDSILDSFPEEYGLDEDMGNINEVLADNFPEDRMGIAYFQRDYNYSRYSYERFWEENSKDDIHAMWWDDTQLLMSQYDSYDNMSYYIPYYRELNTSHCTIIGYWTGTEIQEADMRMDDYVRHLLDRRAPLQSWLESVQPDEDVE